MRDRTRRYIDNYPVLNLTKLVSNGLFNPGTSGTTQCKSHSRVLWGFGWDISATHIKASYIITRDEIERHFTHNIKLHNQDVNFGGSRAYLECPRCHSMRKQIYFRDGVAACRTCHGLHYRSQSTSYEDRQYVRLDRLLKKVHNFGYRFDGYWKSKGQHWKTFYKLSHQINATQRTIFANIDKRFGTGEAERYFG